MNNVWPLIILTVGGIYLFSRNTVSNLLSRLVIKFRRIQPDLVNSRIILIFDFYNPLPVAIPLDSIFGNVTLNNSKIVEFFNFTPQLLAPGNNQVEIYTTPTVAGITNLINQIQNTNVKINYTLNSKNLSYSDFTTF
jgi:LEA14-like dessication related protein